MTTILYISDIHYSSSGTSENQGKVLSAFLEDASLQLQDVDARHLFVLIGGDLTQAANHDEYKSFDENFIQPIIDRLSLDRSQILIVPGNHDAQQSIVNDWEETYVPCLNNLTTEDKFIKVIHSETQSIMFTSKFHNFDNYATTQMKIPGYSTFGYQAEINSQWGVYCLNSSLCSYAAFQGKNDKGIIAVDTRGIYEWLNNSNYEHRVLLMHHPLDWMSEWCSSELKKIISQHFDLVLTGHTHEQELLCNSTSGERFVHVSAPQLFTHKRDQTLGYSILNICDSHIYNIIYRQWSDKRGKFRPGMDFTDEDDGIVSFSTDEHKLQTINTSSHENKVSILLEKRMNDALKAFCNQPLIWVDRYLCIERLDKSSSLKSINLIAEADLISNPRNIRVIAPPQYGMTCFGIHFLRTLWKSKNQFGVFVDCKTIKAKKIEQKFNDFLIEYGQTEDSVKWIVLDNWNPVRKEANAIISFLKNKYENVPVIFLASKSEYYFEATPDIVNMVDCENLFLTPIQTSQMRKIVDAYNTSGYIAEGDVLLKRLNSDIIDFNMHRTPFNCITLLEVFHDSFEENPINRTAVLDRVLNIVFDNTNLPTYRESIPDVHDCEFALGSFCSTLIRRNRQEEYSFTEENLKGHLRDICKKWAISLDVNTLFEILCCNKIILKIDDINYVFRFSVWVYYFAAIWMHKDDDFKNYILGERNYIHYPEIIEFFTGKNRDRNEIAPILSKDLSESIHGVQNRLQINAETNPFGLLKFQMNEESKEKILQSIDQNIQRSSLPPSIKDNQVDILYNPSTPFKQSVYKVIADSTFKQMIVLIENASKALRNSDQARPDAKRQMLDAILDAWKTFAHAISLLVKQFAAQGYIDIEGACYKLDKTFDDYTEDDKIIHILTSIPTNILRYFKDDLYSIKLSELLIQKFEEEKDKIKKHLVACLIIQEQPKNWEISIKKYIDSIGQNSYYLGTVIEMLSIKYHTNCPDHEIMRLKQTLKIAAYKAKTGRMPNSPSEINSAKYIGLA